MKKLKYQILFTILMMTIGIAAVTSSLVLSGSTELAANHDDFDVYFSRVEETYGHSDYQIDIINERNFTFKANFSNVGEYFSLDIYVTNASKLYDAEVNMSCTNDNSDYISLNYLSTNTPVQSRSTKILILDLKLIKAYAGEGELKVNVTCTLNASAVERNVEGTGAVSDPLDATYYIGSEVVIGTEKFNVIKNNGDGTITMLAQYNVTLVSPYRQSDSMAWTYFSNSAGWEYSEANKDININSYSGPVSNTLLNYLLDMNREYGIEGATYSLITLDELRELGCSAPEDYAFGDGVWTCDSSPYKDWLVNGQWWWTRSPNSETNYQLWVVNNSGSLGADAIEMDYGVRPTITISVDKLKQLTSEYLIGQEVSIGDEKFNVISDNGTTVSMLAKYNLDADASEVKQTSSSVSKRFSTKNGWEYSPAPKEINIQNYDGATKTALNNYVLYLKNTYNVFVTADLITLNEIGKLGCPIPEDYNGGTGSFACTSPFTGRWLKNGQSWWTRSADSKTPIGVWLLDSNGTLRKQEYNYNAGIRPVITISKQYLEG